MKTIDCLGEMCPIPILKIKKALKVAKPQDIIMVITDHSCVEQSIINHLKKEKNIEMFSDEVTNGIWEITITVL